MVAEPSNLLLQWVCSTYPCGDVRNLGIAAILGSASHDYLFITIILGKRNLPFHQIIFLLLWRDAHFDNTICVFLFTKHHSYIVADFHFDKQWLLYVDSSRPFCLFILESEVQGFCLMSEEAKSASGPLCLIHRGRLGPILLLHQPSRLQTTNT